MGRDAFALSPSTLFSVALRVGGLYISVKGSHSVLGLHQYHSYFWEAGLPGKMDMD